MKSEKVTYVFALLLVIFLFVLGFYDKRKKQEEIKKYDGKSIAYLKKAIYDEGYIDVRFYFYHNGEIIFKKQSVRDENQIDILNDYFVVTFDTKNPNNNYIQLDKSLQPDSLTLVKVGFKYKKYYEHNIATNTYIEHYKWE